MTNDDANALGVMVVTPIVTCNGNMSSSKSDDCVDGDVVCVEACSVSAVAWVTSDVSGSDLSVELRVGVVGVDGNGESCEYDASDVSTME